MTWKSNYLNTILSSEPNGLNESQEFTMQENYSTYSEKKKYKIFKALYITP